MVTTSNHVRCEPLFNEHHLLVAGKNLELIQTNLKRMIINALSFHYHNSTRMNLKLLLGEGDTSLMTRSFGNKISSV